MAIHKQPSLLISISTGRIGIVGFPGIEKLTVRRSAIAAGVSAQSRLRREFSAMYLAIDGWPGCRAELDQLKDNLQAQPALSTTHRSGKHSLSHPKCHPTPTATRDTGLV
jgi:hypothetical protein